MVSLVAEVQEVICLRESLKAELVFHGYSDAAGRMGDWEVDIRDVTPSPQKMLDLQRPVSHSACWIHDTWLCRWTERSWECFSKQAVIPQSSRIPDRRRIRAPDEAHIGAQDSEKVIRPKSSVRAVMRQDARRTPRSAKTGIPSQASYVRKLRQCGERNYESNSEAVPLLRRWLPPKPSRIPKPPISKDNILVCNNDGRTGLWSIHRESCIPHDSDRNQLNGFCISTQKDSSSSLIAVSCDRRAEKSTSCVYNSCDAVKAAQTLILQHSISAIDKDMQGIEIKNSKKRFCSQAHNLELSSSPPS